MRYFTALLASLFASVALASTTYNLPSAQVYVNLASNHTTVGVPNGAGGTKYFGANSQFVYFAPCEQPDTSRYHCTIQVESNVVLVASDGSTAVANITAKFESILLTSGHNQWRQAQTVLSGDVTVQ